MEAADRTRCQAEKLAGSFMTLGPRRMERCANTPTRVVRSQPVLFGKTQDEPAGEMSMCDECFDIFVKVAAVKYVVEKV